VAIVQEGCVNGVSTRKVDRLVEQNGAASGKDQVSRLCRGLDEHVRVEPHVGVAALKWALTEHGKVEKVRAARCTSCATCSATAPRANSR
jgi:hypothetical protein